MPTVAARGKFRQPPPGEADAITVMPEPTPTLHSSAGSPEIELAGAWTLNALPFLEPAVDALECPTAPVIRLQGQRLSELDTAGAWLVDRVVRRIEERGRGVEFDAFRPEHARLLEIVRSHRALLAPAPSPALSPGRRALEAIGRRAWAWWGETAGILAFFGEASTVLARSLVRPARIRWRAVLHNLQTAGFNALAITGLLSFLMGVVIAYQGASQLRRYGANIFVADLVGLSMLRELAPLLTAVIVAGRSGSAYAAQIGTMKVTEEIDALRTIGVSPMELLVLPKLIALAIALPLLTVYADALGVLGGMVLAKASLGVGFAAFLDRLRDALTVGSYVIGVGKAPVFAEIIAVIGCFQGFQATGGADSVGRQTTVSVVQSIFLVIVADALFSVLFNLLGI